MTQIPGITASVAQTQITQKQQSTSSEKTRQSSANAAQQAARLKDQQHEFVRDMAEATGLTVDPDGKNEQETRKRKRMLEMGEAQEDQVDIDSSEASDGDSEARDHATALLMDETTPGPQSPPPCMIDIEA